jgi:Siphovirus ReqiPepy6 Gp37-like protein
MEVYILDENLEESVVVEGYHSLIWTERYSAAGDFQIVINATQYTRTLYQPETFLAQKDSDYVMQIKTVSDATDDTGAEVLTITGASLEAILNDRVGMPANSVTDFADNPTWIVTGTPGNIARQMFKNICVDLVLDPGDGVPFYTAGTYLPHGSIAEPTELVTVTASPDTLYNTIKKVCDTYGLGFRLIRKRGVPVQVFFEIYTGDDHTSGQSTYAPVIFGPNLDNLADTTKLVSTASYKTIAYVVGKDQVKVVYNVGVSTTPSGFTRKVMVVSASDIDTTSVADVDSALEQRGLEALAQNQKVYQFDGEISQYGQFQYGKDYKLGDLVEERDATGYGNQMRVTEQIFVSDDQGDRSYPTLALTLTLVPGTWSDVAAGEEWDEEANNQFWANQ